MTPTLQPPATFTPGSAVFLSTKACSAYSTSPLLSEVIQSCRQGEVIQVLADDLYRVRFKREGCGFYTMLCERRDLVRGTVEATRLELR